MSPFSLSAACCRIIQYEVKLVPVDGRHPRLAALCFRIPCPRLSEIQCRQSLSLSLHEPLSPGFKFDRYDRELRRPFPLHPEFATESNVWRREHVIANTAKPAGREVTTSLSPPPVAVNGWNSREETLSCHNR